MAKAKAKTAGVANRPEWVRGVYGGGDDPPAPEELVYARLDKNPDNDRPVPTLRNVVLVLDNDSRWTGAILFDEFRRSIFVHGEELFDEIEGELGLWLTDHYCLTVPTPRVREAILIVARRHPTHPVREYLEALQWDGTERLSSLPIRCLGAEDTPIIREMFRRWAISAVARAMKPGCKVDTCLILIGPQGTRKSSALRELAGTAWFADTPVVMGKKDAFEQLAGVWVYELAELDSVRRADASGVKAFISSLIDHYRPSYGRNVVTVPRQCVFVGSTNEGEFLSDPTGSRRFWPIKTSGTIDLDTIRAERDQVWAEAVALYRAGEQWWLERDGEIALAELSEAYEQGDAWSPIVSSYLLGKSDTSIGDVMVEGLQIKKGDIKRADQMRVAAVLAKLGWEKYRQRERGNQEWRWRRPTCPSTDQPIFGVVGHEKAADNVDY